MHKLLDDTPVLPAPFGWITQGHPHRHEYSVIAPGHTDVVPAVLSRKDSSLIVLQGNGPQGLLALGVHEGSLSH